MAKKCSFPHGDICIYIYIHIQWANDFVPYECAQGFYASHVSEAG